MNKEFLKRYAHLIVRTGANVQPGQKVLLRVQADQAEMAALVVEECYRAGAKYVSIDWSWDTIDRLHYQYADTEVLGEVLPWEVAKGEQQVKDLPVRIFLCSDDPDALNGMDAEKVSTVHQMRAKVLRKFRYQMDGRHQWCIAGVPCVNWAKKVFPDCSDEEAVEQLWKAILKCCYMDTGRDAVEVWAEHTAKTQSKSAWLNAQNFVKLHYKSSNGTDFTVGLIPSARWDGAGDTNHTNGAFFTPNLPTEEVFTTPMKGQAEGTLVSTKPLSWNGQIIDQFSITYQNGKAVSCKAKMGEEVLEQMLHMDEGASMLGEVALVPKESPINQSGLLFYNTLFDENACCHMAAGMGFGEVIDGYLDMTREELGEKGVNDSLIHVDYMVGSDDLEITGFRADGSSEKIFVNGTWA